MINSEVYCDICKKWCTDMYKTIYVKINNYHKNDDNFELQKDICFSCDEKFNISEITKNNMEQMK